MQKYFVHILILLISLNTFASRTGPIEIWLKMYPLNSCPGVVLEYIPLKSSKYKIRIPSQKKDVFIVETIIEDLNDLSKITNYINEAESQHCPLDNLSLSHLSNEAACSELTKKYSEKYVDLVKYISEVVQKDRQKACDNFIPFIKLQTEVEQLGKEDILKFKNSKNISHKLIKTFVDDSTDELIDHYYACGGKKGSSKFIKNMILMEARNACIVPKPQGALSWEQASELATQISEKYSNKSLIKLNSSLKDITYDAIMGFVETVTTDMAQNLLGPFMDEKEGPVEKQVDDFVNNLESYKNLKSTKVDDITSYVSYVYSADAGIEVGQKALPYLIKSNFKDKLPTQWSQERKDSYLNDVLIKTASDSYDKCMLEEKNHAHYTLDDNIQFNEYALEEKKKNKHLSFDKIKLDFLKKRKSGEIKTKKEKRKTDEETLAYRIGLKEQFCTNFPEKCSEKVCGGSPNILSPDDSATDTQRVQGCVLKSLTLTIKPLLSGIIRDQKEAFIESFDLTNEMADDFTEKTWNTLKSCVNRKLATKNNVDKADFINEDKYLQNISTKDFESYIVKCSDIAENKVSKEFVTQLLLNQAPLKEAFNTGEDVVDQYGNKHNQEIIDRTYEITTTSFTPCLEKQYELLQSNVEHGLNKKNSMLCTPIVEMNASILVVQKELQDMAKEKGIEENSEVKLALKEYEACGESAINNAIENVGSTNSSTPINTFEDSKSYLDRNPSLFNCVENAISNMSFIIAGSEFENIANEQKDKLQFPEYMLSLKNNTQNAVKECFSDGLNNLDYYGYITKDKNDNEFYRSVNASTIDQAKLKLKNKNYHDLKKQGYWSAFTSFNEDDGLARLQKECELVASQEIIPKLLIKEAGGKLLPLTETGFLKDKTEVGNILAQEAYNLRSENNIQLPKDIKPESVVEFSLSEGLAIHIDKGGTMESFIDDFSKRIEKRTITNIHSTLLNGVVTNTSNINQKSKFTSLEKYFPATCLQDINNILATAPKKEDTEPLTMDALVEFLQTGLKYSFERSNTQYYSDLNKLKYECATMNKFKNASDFNNSMFYKIIIKGQIYNTFKDQFKEQIDNQISTMSKELTNPNLEVKKKYTEKLQADMNSIFDKDLTPAKFEKMMFSDSELLDFTAQNLDKILDEDPKTKDLLTQMLLTKSFKETEDDSFASNFAKAQLVASIGITGVDTAVEDANKAGTIFKISSWRFGPNNIAMSAAKDTFGNPQKIEKALDWENISKEQKDTYINSISYASVVGATKNKHYPKDTKESLMRMLKNKSYNSSTIAKDTNSFAYMKIAEAAANIEYSTSLESAKKQLDQYVQMYGYKDFNKKVDSIAQDQAIKFGLINESSEARYTFNKGPKRTAVANMIAQELRSKYTVDNISKGLETHKYSNDKTFIENLTKSITDRTIDKTFGQTPEQKKAREERRLKSLQRQIDNPLMGPKF